MIDCTEKVDSLYLEFPDYKLEDPKYVLDVLKEYHEQTVEDCRIIGNQKYSILISLSIALGSFIYALTQICASTQTNLNYTLEGTLKTLYSSTPSVLSLTGNTSSVVAGSKNIELVPIQPTLMTTMIFVSLFLFILIFIISVSGFAFLWFHLPLMDAFAIKIEELQRDILFKKMGNVDLFSWDDIKDNKSKNFKDYLKQKFIPENVESVNTNINDCQIRVDITITKYLIKKEKKSGTLTLNKDKMIAILKIDGVELDQFKVDSDFILYESEMKSKFRNLMPHTNVVNDSKNAVILSFVLTFLLLVSLFSIFYF